MKIRQVGAELFQAAERTDRLDEANDPFRHFVETPKTAEFDWFTGIGNLTKTIIETSTEKVLSLADCSGLNKQEVSEQFLCWDKLCET
jgi:hypothetical protein